MAILDKLRPQPRWKHADATVRIVAVDELDDTDQELLASIAQADEDARVRRVAVQKLRDPHSLTDLLREDPDEQVREDARQVLLALAVESVDPADAEVALAGLTEPRDLVAVAKTAEHEAIRVAAVARLDDSRWLANVARQAADGSLRLRALGRITEVTELRNVAVKSEYRDVAVAAVERLLDDPESLSTVVARAKHKAASRRARAVLQAQERDEVGAAASPRGRLELCQAMEALTRSEDWGRVHTDVLDVEAGWRDLGPPQGPRHEELMTRFTAAHDAVVARLAGHEQGLVAEQRRLEEQARALGPRVRLCEALEALVREIPPPEASPAAGGEPGEQDTSESSAGASGGLLEPDDVLARVDEARTVWAALAPVTGPDSEGLSRRFEESCRSLERRRVRWMALRARRARREALCQEAQRLLGQADLRQAVGDWKALRRRWSELEEEGPDAAKGSDADLAARFDEVGTQLEARKAQTLAEQATREREHQASLRTLCDELEELSQAEDLTLRRADLGARRAREALEQLGSDASSRKESESVRRLRVVRTALAGRIRELRDAEDWERWANVGVQEELCARLEALRELSNVEEVAKQLGEIQDRWAQVRAVPPDRAQALLLRFRGAQHEVRARCDAYFSERAEERAKNLEMKLQLCQQAEALAESTNWKRTAEELKRLQSDWKAIGPVPRRDAKPVWNRFRSACDIFFTRRAQDQRRRKDEWAQNLSRKGDLCARAEALQESTDWVSTAAELRRLQAEWKTVGPVRHRHADVVWTRFRASCDHFFQRYQQRDTLESSSRVQDREAICAELEALVRPVGDAGGAAPVEGGDEVPPAESAEQPGPSLLEQVQALRGRWQRAKPLPKEQAAPLEERFDTALERLVATRAEALRGSELDSVRNRQRMEQLCERIEGHLEEVHPPVDEDESPAMRLARSWRDAMAANTIGGKVDEEARWRRMSEAVMEARADWQRLGPVPRDERAPLESRFAEACARVAAISPGPDRGSRRGQTRPATSRR